MDRSDLEKVFRAAVRGGNGAERRTCGLREDRIGKGYPDDVRDNFAKNGFQLSAESRVTIAPTVLITGASGFVGSHIAERFVQAGYRVRCGLRSSSSSRWLEHLDIERCCIDFAESDTLRGSVHGADIVVHAAGTTRARSARSYHTVNTAATVRLARAAQGEGVRRFVFISSLAARGPDRVTPQGVARDHPVSRYGESKLEAEKCLRGLPGNLEVVVLRPPAVYGPRDKDVLPVFRLARAGFLPKPVRGGLLQFVFVTDLAEATFAAATGAAGFGPYAVAEAATYTWSEVALVFERAFSRTVRIVPVPTAMYTGVGWASEAIARLRGVDPDFDIRRSRDVAIYSWTCETQPAERQLSWRAGVGFAEGVVQTAEWYRDNGWL